MLFLKPAAAQVSLPGLAHEFPALAAYRARYARAAFVCGELCDRRSAAIGELRAQFGLDAPRMQRHAPAQTALFPIEK